MRVEVLCVHQDKLEVAPFLCCWSDEGWIVAGTRRRLRDAVVGWRTPLRLLPKPKA